MSLENILSPKSTDMPAIQMSSRKRRIITCAAEASNVALADAQQSRLQSGERVNVQRAPALAGARGGAAQVTETEDDEEDEGDEEEAVAAEAAVAEPPAAEAAAAEAAAAEEDAEQDMSAEAIDMLAEEFGYEQRIARADLRKEIILFTQQQEVWN